MVNKFNSQLKGGSNKMGFEPKIPDFSGDGLAIWKAKDKNDKTYLKVKVLQGKAINCFAVKLKEDN